MPHRHRLAAAHAQIEVEDLGLHFARRRHDDGQQRRAVAGDDVGQLQPARADLRQIVVEPVRQRGVDVGNVAGRIGREEAARRVVEIFDRVLQFLEHVFLPLAVAGDVGDRPDRVFRPVLGRRPAAARACAASAHGRRPAPATRTSSCCRLPSREAFSRRNTTSETSGLPMKTRSTGRASSTRSRAGQRQIGRVGVDDVAARIGHRRCLSRR